MPACWPGLWSRRAAEEIARRAASASCRLRLGLTYVRSIPPSTSALAFPAFGRNVLRRPGRSRRNVPRPTYRSARPPAFPPFAARP
eukprot:13510995-Alexandrium_andersonii.AAC.1